MLWVQKMRFKLTCEVSESEMTDVLPFARKIVPLYKSKAEAADIEWIHENKDNVVNAACTYVWELYCEAFADDMILSKNTFNKLVKRELGLNSKMTRIANDTVKYCFVSQH